MLVPGVSLGYDVTAENYKNTTFQYAEQTKEDGHE